MIHNGGIGKGRPDDSERKTLITVNSKAFTHAHMHEQTVQHRSSGLLIGIHNGGVGKGSPDDSETKTLG